MMVRSGTWSLVVLVLVLWSAQAAQADSTGARLARLEAKQDEMNKKLDAILEGQQKSSEEHTQIRYWVKRS